MFYLNIKKPTRIIRELLCFNSPSFSGYSPRRFRKRNGFCIRRKLSFSFLDSMGDM